jgi:hypothetical protein
MFGAVAADLMNVEPVALGRSGHPRAFGRALQLRVVQ